MGKKEESLPLVSCVLLSRDRVDSIRRAILCFEQQDHPNRELVIIDDGGDDLSSLSVMEPRVRVMQLPEGIPSGTKLDYACHMAEGDYIAIWAMEYWSGPDRLSRQLALLLSEEAGLCSFEVRDRYDPVSRTATRATSGVQEQGSLMFARKVWQQNPHGAELESLGVLFQEAVEGGCRAVRLPANDSYVALRDPCYGEAPGQVTASQPLDLPEEVRAWFEWRPTASPQAPVSESTLVSCIMPTADRHALLGHAIRQFIEQDYPDRELIVLDSGMRSAEPLIPADSRIRYRRVDPGPTLGELRNLACEEARGVFIAHWDDDDWIAPWRLSYQIEQLKRHDADLAGLDRLYFSDPVAGASWEYVYPRDQAPWVAGGTMCYRKAFWERNRFDALNVGEDNFFAWSCPPHRLLRLQDRRFYVASIHRENTSPKGIEPSRWRHCPYEVVKQIVGPGWSEFARLLSEVSPRPTKPRLRHPAHRPSIGTASPLVSCVLATRDRTAFFRQALRCYLRQSYRPSELIVVDDGGEPVDSLCRGLEGVQYVRCPEPMSLGAKLNLAIEHARGDIIQKLDDDDYYAPDFLKQAVAHHDRDRIVAWCCFLVLLRNDDRLRFSGHGWSAGGTLAFSRNVWERVPFRDIPRAVDQAFLRDAGLEVNRVCAPESYLYVRHGVHTWQELPDGTSVEAFFRNMPAYSRSVSQLVEPIDRPFYASLCRGSG